jgi:flagellar motor component MotA
MGRIILTEEEKKNIKDMYSNVKSSNKVMSYLKRNFQFFRPVDEMGLNDEEKEKRIEELPFLKDLVKIVIDDKSFILTNEKKYIKKRIFNMVEDDIDRIDPEATKAVVLKTIKDYIDNILVKYNLK